MPTVTANNIWTGSERTDVQFEVSRYPIQIGLQAGSVRANLAYFTEKTNWE